MCMKTEIQDNKNQLFLEKNPYVLKIVSFLCPVAESLFTLSPLKTEVPSVPLFAQSLGRPLTSMQALCKVGVCLHVLQGVWVSVHILQGVWVSVHVTRWVSVHMLQGGCVPVDVLQGPWMSVHVARWVSACP